MYRQNGVIKEERDEIRLAKEASPKDMDMEPLLKPMILGGKIVEDFSFSLAEARRKVLEQLKDVESGVKKGAHRIL